MAVRHFRPRRKLYPRLLRWNALAILLPSLLLSHATAQSVCLPLPRLLSITPMGGKAGTQFEVTIQSEHAEQIEQLRFQHPGVIATPIQDPATGELSEDRFRITIAPDVPPGLYEARVLCRLGISAARIFSVGTLPETTAPGANHAVASACQIELNSIVNATCTARAVDHFRFEAAAGTRYWIQCDARAVDSKLDPVLIVADAEGRDLVASRSGDRIDLTATADGPMVIKVHDLTFKGGPGYFYRLSVQPIETQATIPSTPSVQSVTSYSWPPEGLPQEASLQEQSPDEAAGPSQSIPIPCDLAGSFYPAADVDLYEFDGKKGEALWIEMASERLGRPTDAAVLVQRWVSATEGQGDWTDLVELADIPSPIKPSSNGYAYDGPPYETGSADVLGKVELPEDGRYRLQVRDLFGGTREDRRNRYRLVIRKAQPDFALVGWGMHMELRNGDRAAFSKPLALRPGITQPVEVAVFRRDGFAGDIELVMEGLPPGVTAQGLKIAAGKTRGLLLVTASGDAPRGIADAQCYGKAVIDGVEVRRPLRMAQMIWPVADAWSEIPVPRLVGDLPVSVSPSEPFPLTLESQEAKVYEVVAGQKVAIPIKVTRRSEFSGSTLQLRTMGEGFEQMPRWDLPIQSDQVEAIIDTGALKIPPGDHALAFYGAAVAKYRYNPNDVEGSERVLKEAQEAANAVGQEVENLNSQASQGTPEAKEAAMKQLQESQKKKEIAQQRVQKMTARHQAAKEKANPRDTAEIVVSQPIRIRVKPAEQP
jgi:hypothetical protein